MKKLFKKIKSYLRKKRKDLTRYFREESMLIHAKPKGVMQVLKIQPENSSDKPLWKVIHEFNTIKDEINRTLTIKKYSLVISKESGKIFRFLKST